MFSKAWNSSWTYCAVTTTLGIIAAINQHIIDTAPMQMRAGHRGSISSLPLCISILKDTENLVEVVAQNLYGDDKKWNFMAFTEATKAFMRLALFHNNGYKILLRGGEMENVARDPNLTDQGMRNFVGAVGHPGLDINYKIPNSHGLEGRALSALSQFGQSAKMICDPAWLSNCLHHQSSISKPLASVLEKPTLLSILSEKRLYGGLFVLGEALLILRPFAYVLLIQRYGVQSWAPWLISLVIDIFGMSILSRATNPSCSGRKKVLLLSAMEEHEMKRRKLLWALYLMRDPLFSNYTRPCFERSKNVLAPFPFIGVLTEKLVELISGAQTRYTYTSAS